MSGEQQDQPAEGEIVTGAAGQGLAQREQSPEMMRRARNRADLHEADAVAVKPFGWQPTGRLAELVNRADPDDRLSMDAARLIFEGVPKNTRETYARLWRTFLRWCGEMGRVECPATPATVIEFMNHLWRTPGRYGRPTAPTTVRLYLSVIAVVHRGARRPEKDERGHHLYGYVPPTGHPDVQRAMRGYAKQWLAAGHRPDTAYPLPPDELAKMLATLDGRSVVGVQKSMILTVGYAMGARRSELAGLNMEDIELHVSTDDPDKVVDDVDHLIIHVPMSKTDQSGEGDDVAVYATPVEDAILCPVRWTMRWLAWRREKGIPETGPFVLVVRTGNRAPTDGRPRSGRIVAGMRVGGELLEDIMAGTARDAGLLNIAGRRRHIVPQSLRAGSAESSAEAGADTPALNRHYRWSPRGTTAQRYVRSGLKKKMNPVRGIYQERRRQRQERQAREQGGGE